MYYCFTWNLYPYFLFFVCCCCCGVCQKNHGLRLHDCMIRDMVIVLEMCLSVCLPVCQWTKVSVCLTFSIFSVCLPSCVSDTTAIESYFSCDVIKHKILPSKSKQTNEQNQKFDLSLFFGVGLFQNTYSISLLILLFFQSLFSF